MNHHLKELLKASEGLRDALVSRDPAAIWTAVSRQERAVEICLKAHAARPAAGPTNGIPVAIEDAETHALAAGIRRIQQTNKRVASSFLEVVDRTLASLSAGAPRHPVTYGAEGWSRPASTPVLVHRFG